MLGISVDAVRGRVRRGTIPHEREAGRVYVYVDTDQDAARTPDRTDELIATLREQLAAERAAHSEARRLLAAALERIPPQIEPPEPRESPERAADAPPRGTVPAEPQTASEPRSWWRRMFGG